MSATGTELVRMEGGNLEVGGVKKTMVTFTATEKDLLKITEELTTEELQTFFKEIESVSTEDMRKLIFGLFNFMGFDPEEVVKRLISIHKYYVETVKLEGETRETFIKEIVLMCAASVAMGNLQQKSKDRRSGTARQVVEYLSKKYGITTGSTGTGQASTVLTFPRIASSFPSITLRISTFVIPKSFPGKPFETINIPSFMRVSAFCSLLHADLGEKTRTFLLQAACAYSADQSIVFHEGENKKKKLKGAEHALSPEDAFSSQWDFFVAAADSKVPPLATKKSLLVELKVSSFYDAISKVVVRLRTLIKDDTPVISESVFKAEITSYVSGPSLLTSS